MDGEAGQPMELRLQFNTSRLVGGTIVTADADATFGDVLGVVAQTHGDVRAFVYDDGADEMTEPGAGERLSARGIQPGDGFFCSQRAGAPCLEMTHVFVRRGVARTRYLLFPASTGVGVIREWVQGVEGFRRPLAMFSGGARLRDASLAANGLARGAVIVSFPLADAPRSPAAALPSRLAATGAVTRYTRARLAKFASTVCAARGAAKCLLMTDEDTPPDLIKLTLVTATRLDVDPAYLNLFRATPRGVFEAWDGRAWNSDDQLVCLQSGARANVAFVIKYRADGAERTEVCVAQKTDTVGIAKAAAAPTGIPVGEWSLGNHLLNNESYIGRTVGDGSLITCAPKT